MSCDNKRDYLDTPAPGDDGAVGIVVGVGLAVVGDDEDNGNDDADDDR